jgi:trimeric autotransporter adhesin
MKKNKSFILLAIFFVLGENVFAQSLAINTDGSTASASALLDVKSTAKGILIPRMTSVQRTAIGTPANGLMVYDTDSLSFAYYNGSTWSFLKADADISKGWSVNGNNNITASNFFGTTTNADILFKRNNVNAGFIRSNTTAFGVGSLGAGGNLYNTAVGYQNMYSSISGLNNTALGSSNFYYGSSGNYNIAIGSDNIPYVTGSYNIGIGAFNFSRNFYVGQNFMNNIAIGSYAQNQQWHGFENIALGTNALYNDTTGNNNIAIGYHTLEANLSGYGNIGLGKNSLKNNTTAYSNVSIGSGTLFQNTNRSNLVAIGDSALYNNGIGITQVWHANENTAIGSKALFENTFGWDNTAVGFHAMQKNTSGALNIAVGDETLFNNTSGGGNVAVGYQSLWSNISGNSNTALGYSALHDNTISNYNIALGDQALLKHYKNDGNIGIGKFSFWQDTTGQYNIGIGYQSGYSNRSGNFNTVVGYSALLNNKSGDNNIAIGRASLAANQLGDDNIAIGDSAMNKTIAAGQLPNIAIGSKALKNNVLGYFNVVMGNNAMSEGNSISPINTMARNIAIGFDALTKLGTGSIGANEAIDNTAIGYAALTKTSNGWLNTALGSIALWNNTTGTRNTGIGQNSLGNTVDGDGNTAIGVDAGNANISGNNNTYIGYLANASSAVLNNASALGANAFVSQANSMVLGSINGVNSATADTKVGIGVTNPSEKLEIGNGRLRFKGNLIPSGFAHGITWTDNAGTTDKTFIGIETDNFWGIYNYGLGAWNIRVHNTSGEMGINKQPGTTNNDSRLQVKQRGTQNGIGIETAVNTSHWDLWLDNIASPDFNFLYNGGFKSYIQNASGNYIVASDRRLKKDIQPLTYSTSKILALQPYQYHYISNAANDPFSIGFMAQDVQKIFPDAVSEKLMKDGEKRLGINYQYFTVLAIKGLQEQQEQIEALKTSNQNLQKQIDEIKKAIGK